MFLFYVYQIISIIRSFIYSLLMNSNNPNATYNSYYLILEEMKNGSTLLDVGAGDGIYFTNPKIIKIIKDKKLKIKCIDIDVNSINICKHRIYYSNLINYVEAESIDLLDIHDNYDYVLFMDCYPVIELSLMNKLVEHSKKLTNNIWLFHNLFKEKNNVLAYLKPKLKYITLNDFGRLTTVNEMKDIIENKWNFKKFIINQKISSCMGETITFINYIPYLKNIKLYQFLIKIHNQKNI